MQMKIKNRPDFSFNGNKIANVKYLTPAYKK